ncbi:MAG: response regulator transcription factor [Anaerolineae bacterium]|jgi:DNA-binding NarL/FixJ family response regulator|nr:response regulator transcription factor [Anaerolineae bacterium]
MSAIRVMLVDDQRLMREGLRTLLDLEEDIEVIGEAGNGEEGVAAFLALRPDVALMDVRMPVLDGVQATRRIVAADPDARIIILTTFDDDEYVLEGLRAGALGYLLKDVGVTELAEAIRAVMRGGVLIEPSVARKVVAELARLRPAPAPEARPAALVEPLSERELEILRLVAAGLTNRDIAQRLFLAEGTVKNYVTNILGKIGARDRTQAAIAARELGLL